MKSRYVVVTSSPKHAMLAWEHGQVYLRYPAGSGRWIQNIEVLDANPAGVLEVAEHHSLFFKEVQRAGSVSEDNSFVGVDLPATVLDPERKCMSFASRGSFATEKSEVSEEILDPPLL